MQLVNGAQFLNTTSIRLFPPPAAKAATVIVPLTSVYESPQSHKRYRNINVIVTLKF